MSYGVFVLPPPRIQPQLNNAAPAPQFHETNNQLISHSPSDLQLVVGEGTYQLRDDMLLATPPPHPSENFSASYTYITSSVTPITGTRVSLVLPESRYQTSRTLQRTSLSDSQKSTLEQSNGSSSQQDKRSSASGSVSSSQRNGSDKKTSSVPVFGEDNPALNSPVTKETKDNQKKGKPKNNLLKSSSTFLAKVQMHEYFNRRIQEHAEDGPYIIANINRAVQWLDISSNLKSEYLTKLLFTRAHATCHDVNSYSLNAAHMDVAMGFSTGDLIWYEPFSQKYSRINKNGIIHNVSVSDTQWLPKSDNLFLTAHADGTLIVFDKEKEDVAFSSEDSRTSSEEDSSARKSNHNLQIIKSVKSRNQRFNPVAVWRIGVHRINAFAFSPNGQKLAVVAEDGSMRILDYMNEEVVDVYMSYYGGMMCVCWSPDGRYVVTGSQDDLVSVWSVEERSLVARCPGHNSWVTSVAFDPWRCDDRTYRFGSVGEDCRLLLWDFNVGMLHRPRPASTRQRTSISSTSGMNAAFDNISHARLHSSQSLALSTNEDDGIHHPVQPRSQTAVLPPVMAKTIDEHPLSWLGFNNNSIITSCSAGHIRVWSRPNAEGINDAED